MPWTITESTAPQDPVKPPGEPVLCIHVPAGSWVWLGEQWEPIIGSAAFGYKADDEYIVYGVSTVIPATHMTCIPCQPGWRFEARVVDGTLRFVPLVEVERKEEWRNSSIFNELSRGDIVQSSNGGWYISDGEGYLTCLIDDDPEGSSRALYRRPRGPVTLTYTPPEVE